MSQVKNSAIWLKRVSILLIVCLPLALIWDAVSPIHFDRWPDWLYLAAFAALGIAVCYWAIVWIDRMPFDLGRWKKNQTKLRKWGGALMALLYLAMAGKEALDLQAGHLGGGSLHSAHISVGLDLAVAAFWLCYGFLSRPKPKPVDRSADSQSPTFDG